MLRRQEREWGEQWLGIVKKTSQGEEFSQVLAMGMMP